MQKVMQRTAAAKRQAARRASLSAEENRDAARRSMRGQKHQLQKQEWLDIRAARQARREDWELGPLAPKRDVGERKDTYGTVHPRRLQGFDVDKRKRIRFWDIVEGDRVVILTGRDKGKIGEVKATDKDAETVTVQGMNLMDVAVPEWMRKADRDPAPTRSIEAAIPLASVRLVYPMPDPTTGIPRDVIVDRVQRRNWDFDPVTNERTCDRVIPGTDVVIPWPPRERPEEKDNDVDTLRITVEERTWVPTLLRPPMPPSVIDELRNKYSVFRDRHDEEYVARKMLEDEERERMRKGAGEMMTPVQELRLKQKSERKALREKRPSWESIGELVLATRARRGMGLAVDEAAVEERPVDVLPSEPAAKEEAAAV